MNGPLNAAEETPNSTAARNFLFEAVVAARGHRPSKGIEAILVAESDAGISMPGRRIWVECKRVTTGKAIEANVAKASKQVESVINKKSGSGHRGAVALDVSKILNPEENIFVKETDTELIGGIEQLMSDFIQTYSSVWQKVYARRSRKIIGTFVRFAFMASSGGRNLLVHATQWALNPSLRVSSADESLLRHLVSVMRERS